METVSFATASKARATQSIPLIRETLARTRSYATTARQTGFPEVTIRELMSPPPPRPSFRAPEPLPTVCKTPLSPREVIMICCVEEGTTYADMIGDGRTRALAHPRQRMMWMMRKAKPNLSFPEIGRRFGGRDHTTVIHAMSAVEARCQQDDGERAKLEALVRAIADVSDPRAAASSLDEQIAQAEAVLHALIQRRRVMSGHLQFEAA